jgi:hypothetical protein
MDSDNTRDIAEQIFTRPPGTPNSIDLSLDDSSVDFMQENQINVNVYIRDVISMITLHGVEILYGHKNIMSLTDDQLLTIKKYTRSYGYDMKVNVENNTIVISFTKYY